MRIGSIDFPRPTTLEKLRGGPIPGHAPGYFARSGGTTQFWPVKRESIAGVERSTRTLECWSERGSRKSLVPIRCYSFIMGRSKTGQSAGAGKRR